MPELILTNDPQDNQISACLRVQRPLDGRAFSIIPLLFAIRMSFAAGKNICRQGFAKQNPERQGSFCQNGRNIRRQVVQYLTKSNLNGVSSLYRKLREPGSKIPRDKDLFARMAKTSSKPRTDQISAQSTRNINLIFQSVRSIFLHNMEIS